MANLAYAYEDEYLREELIDGVRMMSPASNTNHNIITANILVIIR